MNKKNSPAFSLIEVLFAVAFLVMVGLAMTALNAAALKVIVSNEITTTASVLNDEALAYVALQRTVTAHDEFMETMKANGCDSDGCFVNCPTTLTSSCTLDKSPAPVSLGRSKLSYRRELRVIEAGHGVTVRATTRWGTGIRNQATAYQFLD
jgi:Tfp pilus assembly protein PilV